jgi:hypothetical protein
MSDRHEWIDKAGMPWAVAESADGVQFVEVASYGSIQRSHEAIGAELLRLASALAEAQADRDHAREERDQVVVEVNEKELRCRETRNLLMLARAELAAVQEERDEAISLASAAIFYQEDAEHCKDTFHALRARIASRPGGDQ